MNDETRKWCAGDSLPPTSKWMLFIKVPCLHFLPPAAAAAPNIASGDAFAFRHVKHVGQCSEWKASFFIEINQEWNNQKRPVVPSQRSQYLTESLSKMPKNRQLETLLAAFSWYCTFHSEHCQTSPTSLDVSWDVQYCSIEFKWWSGSWRSLIYSTPQA